MQSRSILGLVYTVNSLNELGYETASALKEFGIEADTLDPFSQIDRVLELKILARLLQDVDDTLAGLKLGQRFALAGYGPFTMLLMTCDNAFEACKTAMQYQNMTYLFGSISIQLQQDHCEINIVPTLLPLPIHRVIIDRDISGTARFITDLLLQVGKRADFIECRFPYSQPPNYEEYQRIMGCPVSFGHETGSLLMDSRYLQQRFPQASPTAREFYRQQCDQALQSGSNEAQSLSSSIRDYLSLFRGKMPGTKEVAQAFTCSERSLRRKLEQEGSRFQGLLDDVRLAKATNWLSDDTLSISQISDRLGYQEPAAFIHAFKRWTGTTPAQFRKNLGSF